MNERSMSRGATRPVSAWVVDRAPHAEALQVLVEEPLAILVAGDRVASTMRTPGEDRFLALGFLYAEGVIAGLDDVGSVYHCGRTDQPGYGNVIEVTPAPGARLVLERARREGPVHSACGICGREGIDDLLQLLATRAPARGSIHAGLLHAVPGLLSEVQPLFASTGGAHAACALMADGTAVAFAEDVGRHNAVDKVVGRLLYERRMPRDDGPVLLAVSGRAGFEIVQKAAMAGFACVASVSAPSSLALEAARVAGVTLASFVREGRFTLYTHADRVVEAASAAWPRLDLERSP